MLRRGIKIRSTLIPLKRPKPKTDAQTFVFVDGPYAKQKARLTLRGTATVTFIANGLTGRYVHRAALRLEEPGRIGFLYWEPRYIENT